VRFVHRGWLAWVGQLSYTTMACRRKCDKHHGHDQLSDSLLIIAEDIGRHSFSRTPRIGQA
jgi:hypothetical protein